MLSSASAPAQPRRGGSVLDAHRALASRVPELGAGTEAGPRSAHPCPFFEPTLPPLPGQAGPRAPGRCTQHGAVPACRCAAPLRCGQGWGCFPPPRGDAALAPSARSPPGHLQSRSAVVRGRRRGARSTKGRFQKRKAAALRCPSVSSHSALPAPQLQPGPSADGCSELPLLGLSSRSHAGLFPPFAPGDGELPQRAASSAPHPSHEDRFPGRFVAYSPKELQVGFPKTQHPEPSPGRHLRDPDGHEKWLRVNLMTFNSTERWVGAMLDTQTGRAQRERPCGGPGGLWRTGGWA